MNTDIEIVSPRSHRDTDCVCRISRMPGLVATCDGCGETVYRRVHLPLIAFGFFCGRCCPCRTFVATAEEAEALRTNRARPDAGSEGALVPRIETPRSHKTKTVTPGKSVEERKARFKQRCADAMKRRWNDPAKRAALMKAIRQTVGRAR